MEGRKDDAQKNRLDLLTFAALEEIGKVLTFGAGKYADDNWKKVPNLRRRYLGAGLRHVFAWARGTRNDAETGLHHLAHAACCFLFVLETELGEDTTNPATWGREVSPGLTLKPGDMVYLADGSRGRVVTSNESGDCYFVRADDGFDRWFSEDQLAPASGAV